MWKNVDGVLEETKLTSRRRNHFQTISLGTILRNPVVT